MQEIYNVVNWNANQNIFPHITYCDFQMPTPGNVHNYSMTCLLTVNVINEKIFYILSTLYLIITFISAINFVFWSCTMFFSFLFNNNHGRITMDEQLVLKLTPCRLFSIELYEELIK